MTPVSSESQIIILCRDQQAAPGNVTLRVSIGTVVLMVADTDNMEEVEGRLVGD